MVATMEYRVEVYNRRSGLTITQQWYVDQPTAEVVGLRWASETTGTRVYHHTEGRPLMTDKLLASN